MQWRAINSTCNASRVKIPRDEANARNLSRNTNRLTHSLTTFCVTNCKHHKHHIHYKHTDAIMLGSSRRNLQSAGSARQASHRPAAADAADLELPPYQEPRLPLTNNYQLKLKELSSNRPNARLQKHADMSAKLLAESVYAINERATNRKEILERVTKKRRGNNDDADNADDDAEIENFRTKADEMKAVVDPLTLKVEKAMRDILDLQAGLVDEKEVLKALPDIVATAQAEQAAQVQQNVPDDEDDEPPEVAGVVIHRIIAEDRKKNNRAYGELSNFQRYTGNNLYVEFKRQWHEGLNPNDEIPVPDRKTWFDSKGQPQHVVGGGEDDSDDEIQISKEIRSTRCPLSLAEMTEPYTCQRCKHTFQKQAIVGYLANGPQICPQTGCTVKVRLIVPNVHYNHAPSRMSC